MFSAFKEDLTKSGLVGKIKTDHVLDETRTTQNQTHKRVTTSVLQKQL